MSSAALAMCFAASGLASPLARARAQAPAKRPMNVLFIMADDLNVDLGCYGHPLVKTPNLDRLAARGVRFARAYCQYPLCSPSRTSLLSGLRPDTTKIYGNGVPFKGATWLPEYFGQNGYFTARVGKIEHGVGAIGAGGEKLINWDVQESPQGNAPLILRDHAAARKAGSKAPRPKAAQIVEWRAVETRDEEEADGITARRVVQLMEQHQNDAKPWFLGAGFFRPHLPMVAPRRYFAMYPPEKIVLPNKTEPVGDRDDIPPIALTRTGEVDRMSDAQKREAIAAYYACVSFLDAQVGVLLDALDKHKLWDNTVVVFLGDHGFHLGEHAGRGGDLSLWLKQTLFEEAARAPLIVAAPGIKPGVSPRLVEFVDLYPTLVELCGLPARSGLEGTSFAPLLSDPTRAWKPAAFSQVTRGNGVMGRGVWTERFRYTEWGSEKIAELYDLQTDPKEYVNLATNARHAKTVAEMKRLLRAGKDRKMP